MTTLRLRLLAGTLLLGSAPVAASTAAAQEQKTPPMTGAISLLARAYADRPPVEERAKLEQYGELPPGVFISSVDVTVPFSAHASAEFSASNVGLDNQHYLLRGIEAGRVYLTLDFRETPHLYSTQALTLFEQTGPSTLKVADPVRTALETATNNAARAGLINANVQPTRLNVTREASRAGLRWTPGPSWDVRLDYSYEDRAGTMPLSAALNGFNAIEMPAPISQTTQNFGASVQYVGKLTDTRRWTMALAYSGSLFNNNLTDITFDNPFRLRPPNGNNASANQGRLSVAPSNEAHRYTLTGSVDLPFAARYVGTASYARMTQNDLFLPFTINPSILTNTVINGLPSGTALADDALLPSRSLRGEVDELLINNQLSMRFGKQWTATARLRHLDIDNNTPLLTFQSYVLADGQRQDDDRQNYRPAYRRSNASFDLNWRPALGWNAGATAGWERYDRDSRDVDVTDEYSQKLFVDARPRNVPWLQARASVRHSTRTAENYDALANVGVIGFPPVGAGFVQNPLMRKFDMADVERVRVDASADFLLAARRLRRQQRERRQSRAQGRRILERRRDADLADHAAFLDQPVLPA
jgi:MtrB/PioB family decaheme-associated outer membrane protein